MKNMKKGLCYFAVLAVSMFALASCSCTQGACSGQQDIVEDTTPVKDTAAEKRVADARALFLSQHVPFSLDSFALNAEAKETLDSKIVWLRANPNARIIVEGHCDERGTQEYNLALGDRRARTAKKYLTDSGIAENRITTISYGEERPLDMGHNEAAWAKNRRAQFVIR